MKRNFVLILAGLAAVALFAGLVHTVLLAAHVAEPAAATVEGLTLRRLWATTAAALALVGVAAGGLPNMGRPLIFGTAGVINGSQINGQPIEYEGMDLDAQYGMNGSLPHVVGAHRGMEEAHVYEDVMQLVDWVRDDVPTVATAEHARHVVEIFDAAYRSAESGNAVELESVF